MFLIFVAVRCQRYLVSTYTDDNLYIHEDFLCIPDVFHMSYLIESCLRER